LPKGKMIEGRSGGSGRGTRRELWAPPDRGSAQPADRTLYRVPTLDPRRPLISSPPPLPHPRTCLLATGKNSAAPECTFSSALVSAEWRAQRENDRREERGIWAGHSKRIKDERMNKIQTSHLINLVRARRRAPSLRNHAADPQSRSSPTEHLGRSARNLQSNCCKQVNSPITGVTWTC